MFGFGFSYSLCSLRSLWLTKQFGLGGRRLAGGGGFNAGPTCDEIVVRPGILRPAMTLAKGI